MSTIARTCHVNKSLVYDVFAQRFLCFFFFVAIHIDVSICVLPNVNHGISCSDGTAFKGRSIHDSSIQFSYRDEFAWTSLALDLYICYLYPSGKTCSFVRSFFLRFIRFHCKQLFRQCKTTTPIRLHHRIPFVTTGRMWNFIIFYQIISMICFFLSLFGMSIVNWSISSKVDSQVKAQISEWNFATI